MADSYRENLVAALEAEEHDEEHEDEAINLLRIYKGTPTAACIRTSSRSSQRTNAAEKPFSASISSRQ